MSSSTTVGSARRHRHIGAMLLPVWRSRVEAAYADGGARFVRSALFAILGLGLVVGLVAASLTRLFGRFSLVDLAVLVVLAMANFAIDGLLARKLVTEALQALDVWEKRPNLESARAAWHVMADLPYRLLRRPLPYVLISIEFVAWDLVATWRLALPVTSFLLILPGSLLVYVYWLGLRFLGMEQLLRPVLADLGRDLPDAGGVTRPRLTLRVRLLTAVPAISVITGLVVAGIVGDHTLKSIALGVLGGIAVAVAISSWLVILLADSVSEPIIQLRQAADRVGAGELDVRVPVVSLDETGSLASAFNSMVEGLRERERLRSAFGAFVDPGLAERVAQRGVDFAGEEIDVSVLFVDVRSFTTYAEQTTPRQVVASLNRLFDQLVPVILEHHGHVNKFVGDGLMAVFGAPERLDNHAECAVAAALEIAGCSVDGLRVGVGVNSGPVLVGTVGGGGRLDFTVIGDAVNTAARVESATRQTGDDLLISGAVLERLTFGRERWVARELTSLKGKHDEVRLFAPT